MKVQKICYICKGKVKDKYSKDKNIVNMMVILFPE